MKAEEVVKALEERGIKLSSVTIYKWVKRGIIPEEYCEREIRGMRTYLEFKPEVVDYIEEKVRQKLGDLLKQR